MLQWVSCSVKRRRRGRNGFCVWRFWRTEICSAYQRGGVGIGCVQGVRGLQANCRGYSRGPVMPFRWVNTSLSKDFMTTDFRATGLESFSAVIEDFLGTGMMVERLKQEGTSHSSRDLLKIRVKMGASWSAQTFRQEGNTPSGPGAFLIFCF